MVQALQSTPQHAPPSMTDDDSSGPAQFDPAGSWSRSSTTYNNPTSGVAGSGSGDGSPIVVSSDGRKKNEAELYEEGVLKGEKKAADHDSGDRADGGDRTPDQDDDDGRSRPSGPLFSYV